MRKVDLVLNTAATREKAYDRLKAKNADGSWREKFLDVAAEMMPLDAEERAHLGRHWFHPHQSWWPKQQPVDIIVRLGMLQIIELVKSPGGDVRGRTVDCYWVNGADEVRLTALLSPTQVTGILFTPEIPFSDRIPADFAASAEPEPIFTVRHASRGPGEILVKPVEDYCEVVQPLIPRERS